MGGAHWLQRVCLGLAAKRHKGICPADGHAPCAYRRIDIFKRGRILWILDLVRPGLFLCFLCLFAANLISSMLAESKLVRRLAHPE